MSLESIKIVIDTKLDVENSTLLDICIQFDMFTNIPDIYKGCNIEK